MEKFVIFVQLNPIIMAITVVMILLQVYWSVKSYNMYGWGGDIEKKIGGIVMIVIFLCLFILAIKVFPSGELPLLWAIVIPCIEIFYLLLQYFLFVKDQ